MKIRQPEYNMHWFEHEDKTFVSLGHFKGFKRTPLVQIHREDDVERVQITMAQHDLHMQEILEDWK